MSKVVALATRRKLQPALKRIPDAVEVVFDLGQWSAATIKEGRLIRRHFATPNTMEAATALCHEMAEREGLRFIDSQEAI
jgi:beta-xylosidase